MSQFAELVAGVSRGDQRAIAHAISLVEDGVAAELIEAMSIIADPTPVIGITGAPGVGKSTLVNVMIQRFRQRGLTVGVLAVDPSSPLTGGALLGDRIRMINHTNDAGVFIRSLSSRGHLGGLTGTFAAVLSVMRAARFDVILIETVGVGQSEVEVMKFADPVVVVSAPSLGDSIQASKAGIVEIANIIVLNKCDLDGADEALAALQRADLDAPVLAVSATTGAGIDDLMAAVSSAAGM